MIFLPVSTFSRAIWSYCDVMFTKRKPYPEKNKKLSCAKWINYFMTMVDIGFKMQPNPTRKRTLENKMHPVECFMQFLGSFFFISFVWQNYIIYNQKYIALKSGKALFQCFDVIVLQYYIPVKEVNHFLNNITLIHPNSSTKATLL